MAVLYGHKNKPVGTWLSNDELEMFRAIALHNRVTTAAYLRAMIVDVIAEEGPKVTVPRRIPKPDIFAEFLKKRTGAAAA